MNESLARRKLLGILSGTWVAQGVYALVKLGVPDLMADGPVHVGQLAHDCGADTAALRRLLRALALMGLFTEPEPDTFGLTPTTELLRADVPGSVRLNALMQGDEVFRSFAEIVHTLRTGRPAFEAVYGRPFYDYLDDNPEAAAVFNESMGDQRPPDGLAECDLTWAGTVVDVGGGNGSLLLDVLTRHPHLRGVLLELPDAAEAARARLAAAGLAERSSCVAGSFFDGVPEGGDAYVLARVLHNWNDDNAVAILRRVHAVLPPHGRVIVLEELLPESAPAASRSAAGLVDLLMLVTLEGRDRTEAEYRELLGKAGFEVVESRDGVLEARLG
ncbi:methyltransferase [Catellatospora bangladeshensis]|uniref:Methyltransferase n=1 Tax=Catellatospora bangladeshensis TaxID=310355 RepID=A0A8J3NGH8_9ACTN|nr:methyltransferase [Catellatospora bangladeshensis]GIF78688.1 methyltransferase [Catellatospora bangladeshensis]